MTFGMVGGRVTHVFQDAAWKASKCAEMRLDNRDISLKVNTMSNTWAPSQGSSVCV